MTPLYADFGRIREESSPTETGDLMPPEKKMPPEDENAVEIGSPEAFDSLSGNDLNAEEAALQARMEELNGNFTSPLEISDDEPKQEEPSATSAESEKVPEKWLGDWTQEQAVEILKRIEAFKPDDMETRLMRKLMGRFGEVGRELKELREAAAKEWSLDPAALSAIKEFDEGLYEALVPALQKALKIQSLDADSVIRPVVGEELKGSVAKALAVMHDATEERLVQAFVPNYMELSGEDAFSDWVYENAAPEVIQAFQDWDNEEAEGKRDALTIIKTYQAYEKMRADEKVSAEEQKRRAAAEAKKKADAAAARKAALSGGTPISASGSIESAGVVSSEDEAFELRLRQIEKEGLRLPTD